MQALTMLFAGRLCLCLYLACHPIEQFSNKLKQYCSIATRCDKTGRNVLAAIHPAAAVIWLV